MKVIHHKKISQKSNLVFLLRKGRAINQHPFFQGLNRISQDFLLSFLENNPVKEKYARIIFLPEGRKVLVMGVGEEASFSKRKAFLAMRHVISMARADKIKSLSIYLNDFLSDDSRIDTAHSEYLIAHAHMANFEFVRYKSNNKEHNFIDELIIIDGNSADMAVQFGNILGNEINHMRFLANMPGGEMTPAVLAKEALQAAKKFHLRVRILKEQDMRRLGMNGIVKVAQGSIERPCFIILEHLRGERNEKPIVFVGKGVTFDTGGLNIKTGDHMNEMHMDMSGGASVLSAMRAIAQLKLKKNIVGLIPAVENMPSGKSYRPGDVIRAMSGKTIEVLNTDAEGRIILADALTYAKKYNPRLVVDLATLTGAAVVALGERASALFTADQKLELLIRDIAERVGDYVWPLPLWEEYESEIKGTFGDVANVGKTRYGGAITAAVFLWQFAKEYPWAHIDIAPRMISIEGDFLAKGSAGAGVALLTQLAREY